MSFHKKTQRPTSRSKPLHPKLPPPYDRMTAADMERETARFDGPIPDSAILPLTPAMRAAHQRARRRGRPINGRGSKQVSLTVERGLLERADQFAQARGFTRAQLVARGLELVMAK